MFILNTIVNRFGLAGGKLPFEQYRKLRDKLDNSPKLITEEFVGIAEVDDSEKHFIDEIVTRGEGVTVTTTAASNYRGFPAMSPDEITVYRLGFTRDDGDVGTFILQTTDREKVKDLHLEFAEICQREGIDAAQDWLLDNPLAMWGG